MIKNLLRRPTPFNLHYDFFSGVVGCSKENFDSYFTKLQNICTDNMNEDVKSNSAAAAAAAAGLDQGKGQQVQQGDQIIFCVKGCVTETPQLPSGFRLSGTIWVKFGLFLHSFGMI